MFRKGIKVIASTSIPQGVVNETIVAEEAPLTRENGGTLRQGDRWFDPTTAIEYLRIDGPQASIWERIY